MLILRQNFLILYTPFENSTICILCYILNRILSRYKLQTYIYFYKCRPYWNCPNQEDNACDEPNECFCLEGSHKNNQICSKYVKHEKKSPLKIQNKLPKGEEKPGNRNQMDRSTKPIGPG